jgi:hypothetical protein
MKSFWSLALMGALLVGKPVFAQKLVDPNAVAPEYREAAEKRRAEQIRQRECARKADEAKVLPRDRIADITRCLAQEEAQTQATAVVHH